MQKRNLGNTGLNPTLLGLGTWPIGGAGPIGNYGDVSEERAWKVLEAYFDGGGNFLDTARAYNNSEKYIGGFLAKENLRESVYISSKSHKLLL